LPKWFSDNYPNDLYQQRYLFVDSLGGKLKVVDGIELQISSAERAILEVLDATAELVSFAHANSLIETMRLLRPELLQSLLESYTSFITK
jgi:Transcriptional regulator, AbiEi antitoxin, Type IV TA system